MQLKLLRDLGIYGEHCPTGSIVEVNEHLARYLIGNGSAVDPENPLTTIVFSTPSVIVHEAAVDSAATVAVQTIDGRKQLAIDTGPIDGETSADFGVNSGLVVGEQVKPTVVPELAETSTYHQALLDPIQPANAPYEPETPIVNTGANDSLISKKFGSKK